jgi:P-type Ca2+ transporter type 2C
VFMELIIDPVCSVAFESEQEEKGIMNRPPRKKDDRFFGPRKILQSFFSGVLLLAMVVGVYFLSIHEGHTDGEVRAIAFSTLITGNIFLILTNLSKTRTAISALAEKNAALLVILFTAFIMLQLILFIPGLRKLFSFEYPGMAHFLPSVLGSVLVLIILEAIKYFRYRKNKIPAIK